MARVFYISVEKQQSTRIKKLTQITGIREKIFQSIDFFKFLPRSDNELFVSEMKVKSDHHNEFSNLSNWKEEA